VTSVDDLRGALQRLRPRRVPFGRWFQGAAVAAIVRTGEQGAELLLIRRAERRGDPWSGDMAFPGGRLGAADQDAFAAALRETREEIGLELGGASLLGRLSDVPTRAPDRLRPMIIAPFVFELPAAPPLSLSLSREVAEVIWVPLDFFRDPRNRSTLTWKRFFVLPCYRRDGRVIWGLTLGMLDELLGALRR
jgi:8-oxo-dGTP pyrophosphatase MutT (NUDIX family)